MNVKRLVSWKAPYFDFDYSSGWEAQLHVHLKRWLSVEKIPAWPRALGVAPLLDIGNEHDGTSSLNPRFQMPWNAGWKRGIHGYGVGY